MGGGYFLEARYPCTSAEMQSTPPGVPTSGKVARVSPPWRQPIGKLMVSLVNSHTNAIRTGWHLWEVDLNLPLGYLQGGKGWTARVCCTRWLPVHTSTARGFTHPVKKSLFIPPKLSSHRWLIAQHMGGQQGRRAVRSVGGWAVRVVGGRAVSGVGGSGGCGGHW